jgi:hypothetical protein
VASEIKVGGCCVHSSPPNNQLKGIQILTAVGCDHISLDVTEQQAHPVIALPLMASSTSNSYKMKNVP